jgi:hypothetical protein
MEAPLEIRTLRDLSEFLQKRPITLVALDIEGEADNPTEVGIGVCSKSKSLQFKRDSEDPIPDFVSQNDIKCLNIRISYPQLKRRSRKRESLRSGEQISISEKDLIDTATTYINRFSLGQELVLIVFSGTTELEWVAKQLSKNLQFTQYADVQKNIQMFGNHPSKQTRPGLRYCVESLNIVNGVWRPELMVQRDIRHQPGNDAVYTLALLSILLNWQSEALPSIIFNAPKRPKLFSGRPRPVSKYPFTAMIRTSDDTPIPGPLKAAGSICKYFLSFSPSAAGTGKSGNRLIVKQLARSWISFSTKADLDTFLSATAGTLVIEGKNLVVESMFIPGMTLTYEETKVKQLANREQVQKQRQAARQEFVENSVEENAESREWMEW